MAFVDYEVGRSPLPCEEVESMLDFYEVANPERGQLLSRVPLVSCTGLCPSMSIFQMFQLPVRLEWYAIVFPSGPQATEFARVSSTIFFGVPPVAGTV